MKAAARKRLLDVLKARFDANPERHPDVDWADVRARLEADRDALMSVNEMEATGGEPDVVDLDGDAGRYVFVDCSAESPAGRRSLCFDPEALEARRKNKPSGSAVGMARAMGIELLDETAYRALQQRGEFDRKTSSWIRTPDAIRQRGGALFCDRRYDAVFTYHNGADAYFAARGFRALRRLA